MRVLPLVALFLLACGPAVGAGSTLPVDRPAQPREVSGRVSFDARREMPTGASNFVYPIAAPFTQVRALAADDAVRAETFTDAEGRFRLDATSAAVQLEVRASLEHDTHHFAVTLDGAGEEPHRFALPLAEADQLDIHVPDDAPASGALHILEVIHRGAEAVRAWTGRTLPPFYIYWSRGVTTDWSFYFGERPADSGRYGVELLGGEPQRRAVTDTDEHDEAIILHEFGHFVMDRLSTDSSGGGSHPGGALLDPGLAWEEGRATWFVGAVLGTGRYRDTIGLEPSGQLRVDHDLERGRGGAFLTGMGSEATVSEVLWDLSDGRPEGASEGDFLPDRDADGVAIGPGGVLAAMIELANEPGAFPALPTLLRHVVDSGRASEDAVRRMLAVGRQDPRLLPPAGSPGWPMELALDAPVGGKIDGLTNPAPSGGMARPSNGYDAVHTYRFEAAQAGWYTIRLEIMGSGRLADTQDLDLELRDLRADVIQRSAGEEPVEQIRRHLEPGWYVVVVRDGGRGNKVDYRLSVSAR